MVVTEDHSHQPNGESFVAENNDNVVAGFTVIPDKVLQPSLKVSVSFYRSVICSAVKFYPSGLHMPKPSQQN